MTVLIVSEKTAIDSIISDVFTFSCLFGGFFINYNFLGNSTILSVFVCIMVLLISVGRANRKVKKMTPKEALKYLSEQDLTE